MIPQGYKDTKVGIIPEDWEVIKLKDTAEVGFSNVDKKTLPEEDAVFLCNYLDVYNNDFINRNINFMPATATEKEIEKFTLIKGDVLLTKDSETPDDIAIPSVVIENLENVLCGYHLAMLRPNPNKVQSVYLSKLLLSKPVNNQFVRLANGLTRFGLNISAFEKVIITIPPLREQQKIEEILTTVDADIEKTDAITKETQQLKKGLMQKFFVRKAFTLMKLAKSEKTNLKPIYFKDFGRIITGTTPSTKVEKYYNPPTYMFAGPADLGKKKIIFETEKYISEDGFSVSRRLPENAVMVVCIGATIGKVGITSEPCTTNQQINSIVPKKEFPTDYVYYVLSGAKNYLAAFSGDTATPILNKGEFGRIVVFVHKDYNKRVEITSILSELDTKIENEQNTKAELEQLKKGLSQVLLTGKVRVKI